MLEKKDRRIDKFYGLFAEEELWKDSDMVRLSLQLSRICYMIFLYFHGTGEKSLSKRQIAFAFMTEVAV